MCRNIKTLFNFVSPATEIEIRDASYSAMKALPILGLLLN